MLSESFLSIQIRSPNNNGTTFVRKFYNNVIPTIYIYIYILIKDMLHESVLIIAFALPSES